MKKLFTLLSLTLLLALGWSAKANATDYYVVGDMTEWTYTPSASITPMSTTDNDTYTAELVVADGVSIFVLLMATVPIGMISMLTIDMQ